MNPKQIAAVVLTIGFTALGITNVVSTQNKLHLKNIEVKSKATELKTLEIKYDHLQIELNKADKNNQQQILDLEKQKQQLEQERIKLQQELSLKRQAKQIAAGKLSKAAGSALGTQVAYADDNSAKAFIYAHESGNNQYAINSIGACGLGQALPCSKMGCALSNYACQDQYFTSYAISRYGSWGAAQVWWQNHLWW